MAGKITTNSVVLGDSLTDTQNFVLKTNADGTATLARGALGALGTVLTVDASSNVTMNLSATSSVNSVNTFGFKNRIINGGMVIDQRNAGASVTPVANGYYTVDRWQTYLGVVSKYSVQQNAGSVTPPVGFSKYLGVTSLAATSLGATDYYYLQQSIEGFNTADLGWGTLNAKTVTLSFQVYSSLTGTFGGAIQNSAGNRSYPFSYSVPVANTWTTASVTITGDTTGTWIGATNGIGLALIFSLGTGTTYSGTAGTWAGVGLASTTGATSVVGTSGATFYITGVQLEVGSTATSFDFRAYSTELALCQNYYQILSDLMCQGYTGIGATVYNDSVLPVPMRTTPTGTLVGTAIYSNASALAMNSTSSTKFRLSLVITALGYGFGYGQTLTFAAEL
jgi:hypothetical protein